MAETTINRESTFAYRISYPTDRTVLQVEYHGDKYAIVVTEDGIIVGEINANDQGLIVYYLGWFNPINGFGVG